MGKENFQIGAKAVVVTCWAGVFGVFANCLPNLPWLGGGKRTVRIANIVGSEERREQQTKVQRGGRVLYESLPIVYSLRLVM